MDCEIQWVDTQRAQDTLRQLLVGQPVNLCLYYRPTPTGHFYAGITTVVTHGIAIRVTNRVGHYCADAVFHPDDPHTHSPQTETKSGTTTDTTQGAAPLTELSVVGTTDADVDDGGTGVGGRGPVVRSHTTTGSGIAAALSDDNSPCFGMVRDALESGDYVKADLLLKKACGIPKTILEWWQAGHQFSVAKMSNKETMGVPSGWYERVKAAQGCQCFPFTCHGVWVRLNAENAVRALALDLEYSGKTCNSQSVTERRVAMCIFSVSALWKELPTLVKREIMSFFPRLPLDHNLHSCEDVSRYWHRQNQSMQSRFFTYLVYDQCQEKPCSVQITLHKQRE
ncbi:hypothetical protein Pelo_15030 [Pelomyxa schiedti]|nr:hypothetical protein Pelo_15030 [Pelomyxa schiedti]